MKYEHADAPVLYLKEKFANAGVDVSDDAIIKITGKSNKPRELLRKYKNEKFPNIAITVELLAAGINVPSICNLVLCEESGLQEYQS